MADPGLVNAGAGDFHLNAALPGLDLSTDFQNRGVSYVDYDGNAIPSGSADRGAFQYIAP